MKQLVLMVFLIQVFLSCKTVSPAKSQDRNAESTVLNDTVVIKSEKTEYEIIIIEPGFNIWLQGTAQPPGYFEQFYLETRNQLFVAEWNLRVNQPQTYDPNLYLLRIDYDPRIDYGYELNYKLYNYFIFFQLKYDQKLAGFVPRN